MKTLPTVSLAFGLMKRMMNLLKGNRYGTVVEQTVGKPTFESATAANILSTTAFLVDWECVSGFVQDSPRSLAGRYLRCDDESNHQHRYKPTKESSFLRAGTYLFWNWERNRGKNNRV